MNPLEELKLAIDDAGLFSMVINLKKHDVLVRAGEKHTFLYFVQSGAFKIAIQTLDEEYIVRFGYQNSFIAALDSFFLENATQYTIEALKASQVLKVDKASLMNLIQSNQQIQGLWQTILVMLNVQQLERELDILTKSPQQRFQNVLTRSPQLFQEIPHKYIANYLRMSPETLSRLKKTYFRKS